jgi:hypothetical protein
VLSTRSQLQRDARYHKLSFVRSTGGFDPASCSWPPNVTSTRTLESPFAQRLTGLEDLEATLALSFLLNATRN